MACLAAVCLAANARTVSADGGFFETLFGVKSSSTAKEPTESGNVTHAFKKSISVRSADSRLSILSFCLNKDGQIVALLGNESSYGASQDAKAESGVRVLSKDGESLKEWKVDFVAQSINVGSDGAVYVAGSGNVAKFSPDGKLLKKLELPHIADFLKNKDVIRKRAEEEARERTQSIKAFVTASKNRINRLEKTPAEKRSLSDTLAIEQLKNSIKMMESDQGAEQSIDSIVQQITARMRIINSVAVSDRDVFIVCGESTGYGYSVWRMDHDFGSARQVMKGLAGCCGQMDVQVHGDDLLVAENCQHSFARFDRDAKKIGEWGGRATGDDNGKCFGGCCNPMNVRCGPNGDIFTAESEGVVKRFSGKGDFVALVAKRPLSGGCKNVAVAASADGRLIYCCDKPGSRINIFEEKPKTVAEAKPVGK
ncbi:MAG TPA: hypothetical protein VFG04_01385 [Planctomycetaceae bacterium]|nr:hypothetical protein [Planctomycetaceae bacterium]